MRYNICIKIKKEREEDMRFAALIGQLIGKIIVAMISIIIKIIKGLFSFAINYYRRETNKTYVGRIRKDEGNI